MKKIISLFSLLIFVSLSLFAQSSSEKQNIRPIKFFVALQPAVDIEPFDEFRNSFDVNILPIQLEYSLSRKWSIRLAPTAYMQFKPEFPAEISRIGTGVTVPFHFAKKNSEEGHRGFYLGPHGALTMNRLDNFMSTTGAVEIGYYFLFNTVLSVNIGAQIGRTVQFAPESGYNILAPHRAGIFAFGIWF